MKKQNYKESESILEEIKKANNILLSCHRSPDLDSVASSLALAKVISALGKSISIISPDTISSKLSFVEDVDQIKAIENIKDFDFSPFDLWILTDTSGWEHVRLDEKPGNIKVVNIDHHTNSAKDSVVELVDVTASSTTDILYDLFKDWGIDINAGLAQLLLAGIVFDTDFFRNLNTSARSHRNAAELIELGADNPLLVRKIDNDLEINQLYLWRSFLDNFKIEEEYNFIWSAVPYEIYVKHPVTQSVTSFVAENMFRRIENLDFVVVMCETKSKYLGFSMRSINPDFKVSDIAIELGGGGHGVAAGASVEGLPFEEAIEKVLEVARKYARKRN